MVKVLAIDGGGCPAVGGVTRSTPLPSASLPEAGKLPSAALRINRTSRVFGDRRMQFVTPLTFGVGVLLSFDARPRWGALYGLGPRGARDREVRGPTRAGGHGF